MFVPLKAANSTDVLPLHKQDLGLSRYKWPRTKLNLFSQLYKQGESGSKEGFPSALDQGMEPPRAHTRLLHTEWDPSPRWRPTRATRNLFWSWSQRRPKDQLLANHHASVKGCILKTQPLLSRTSRWLTNVWDCQELVKLLWSNHTAKQRSMCSGTVKVYTACTQTEHRPSEIHFLISIWQIKKVWHQLGLTGTWVDLTVIDRVPTGLYPQHPWYKPTLTHTSLRKIQPGQVTAPVSTSLDDKNTSL